MVKVEEAIQIIHQTRPQTSKTKLPLEQCLGKTLAQTILAERDGPPFHRVAMDGIAIDSSAGIERYKIAGEQAAGSPQVTLSNKQDCISVMTGAPLPKNCDCVIPIEKIQIQDGYAHIELSSIAKFNNIHPKASDYKQDQILLEAGITISSPVCAVIASQGHAEVEVYANKKIAIVSTGSELVELADPIEDYQIRISNSYALESELKSHGHLDCNRFHIKDDHERIKNKISEILDTFDILILSGGVSMGKYDFIPKVLSELGVQNHFHKITQKPGKPMWYGTSSSGKQVFALPGNPVSCLVCLRRYVIPALCEQNNSSPLTQYAILSSELTFKKNFTLFAPVKVESKSNGQLIAHPIKSNGSGDFNSLAASDGFLELPADDSVFSAGAAYPLFTWGRS